LQLKAGDLRREGERRGEAGAYGGDRGQHQSQGQPRAASATSRWVMENRTGHTASDASPLEYFSSTGLVSETRRRRRASSTRVLAPPLEPAWIRRDHGSPRLVKTWRSTWGIPEPNL